MFEFPILLDSQEKHDKIAAALPQEIMPFWIMQIVKSFMVNNGIPCILKDTYNLLKDNLSKDQMKSFDDAIKDVLGISFIYQNAPKTIETGQVWRNEDIGKNFLVSKPSSGTFILVSLENNPIRWTRARKDINEVFGADESSFAYLGMFEDVYEK